MVAVLRCHKTGGRDISTDADEKETVLGAAHPVRRFCLAQQTPKAPIDRIKYNDLAQIGSVKCALYIDTYVMWLING